jgi:hypothetical protein
MRTRLAIQWASTRSPTLNQVFIDELGSVNLVMLGIASREAHSGWSGLLDLSGQSGLSGLFGLSGLSGSLSWSCSTK